MHKSYLQKILPAVKPNESMGPNSTAVCPIQV